MSINPISIKFLHDTAAQPLVNSKGKKQDRIQFEGLDHKTYLVAAKYGFKEKIPKLNFIEKKFNVIVQVEKDGKTGYIVVNKNSLLKRLNLSSEDLKNAISKNKNYDVTEAVSKKISEIQEKFLTLSKNEMKEKNESKAIPRLYAEAKEQFALHPLNEDILVRLHKILPETLKENSFRYGKSIIYNTEKEARKEQAIEDALESFFDRKDLFPNLKLVKENGLNLHQAKTDLIIKLAEDYVKKSVEPKFQKDVLNYIRLVAYNKDYLRQPDTFLKAWIRHREGMIIVPYAESMALNFFKAQLKT
jgi:hypothetical protein